MNPYQQALTVLALLFGLTALTAGGIGFLIGDHVGTKEGITLAHAEEGIRVSEHDRIMQRVGVCKWAQIMADDHRCKTELP